MEEMIHKFTVTHFAANLGLSEEFAFIKML